MINVPLFYDINTKDPEIVSEAQKEKHIYMDAMAFGMGSCCVQSTYQCCNITEARLIYDKFVVLAPIFLALTAACPIFRGMLADTDVRWNVISASVDDRKREELSWQKKSRYASVSRFISPSEPFDEKYNDLNVPLNQAVFERLTKEAKMDELLAKHFAHLWTRDPLVVYSNRIQIDDEKFSDHFENIQSTNWQTVRFKPPPPGSEIGWRVEFRSMELQLTDFENAAFVILITLLVRVLALFDLNLYIPLSLVDENMQRAHQRDALNKQKFHWRKNSLPDTFNDTVDGEDGGKGGEDETIQLSIHQIINGCENFPGLLPLVENYLDTVCVDDDTRKSLQPYFELISKRASGELLTSASYIRKFVTTHPNYKRDSIVDQTINYDLITHLHSISTGKLRPSQLF